MKLKTTIRRLGNSDGIIIPKKLLEYLEWFRGEDLWIDEKDGKLTIELKNKKGSEWCE